MDNLSFGLAVVLICAVIAVLVSLIYIIRVEKSIIERLEGGSRDNETVPAPQALQSAAEPVEEDDSELIAVISAAVAAALGRPVSSLRVRTIRRLAPESSVWTAAGRQEHMNNRY